MPEKSFSYIQLQRQISDALRNQHPDWVAPNGDCPTCESYESRFVELLETFLIKERDQRATLCVTGAPTDRASKPATGLPPSLSA
jgi:hypothetical protein